MRRDRATLARVDHSTAHLLPDPDRRGLLEHHADEIADLMGSGHVAELGSGSAKKTRLLLAACTRRRDTVYFPIDVSREMLHSSARDLTTAIRGLTITGLWGRYEVVVGPRGAPRPAR